jgi:hypothetical protein
MKIIKRFRKAWNHVYLVIVSTIVALIVMHQNRSINRGVLSRGDDNGNELFIIIIFLLLIAYLMALR